MQTDKVKGQVSVALLSFDLKNKTRWTLFTRGNWAYEQEMLNLRLLGWKQFNNVNVCVFLPRWWISLNFHSITAKLLSTWSILIPKTFMMLKHKTVFIQQETGEQTIDTSNIFCNWFPAVGLFYASGFYCSSADLDWPWGVEWIWAFSRNNRF